MIHAESHDFEPETVPTSCRPAIRLELVDVALQLVDLIENLRDRSDQFGRRAEDTTAVFLFAEQRHAGRFDFQDSDIVGQLVCEQRSARRGRKFDLVKRIYEAAL
ncbi:hypothetical protein [Mesorhizobium waimense]|uniref:hypothetical protein n=1 Tax=Mesorhizobium waimense TaxID=1300307 RepID=UPI001FE0C644|nr:hypothetical protein [Mesorhizobium waimense]